MNQNEKFIKMHNWHSNGLPENIDLTNLSFSPANFSKLDAYKNLGLKGESLAVEKILDWLAVTENIDPKRSAALKLTLHDYQVLVPNWFISEDHTDKSFLRTIFEADVSRITQLANDLSNAYSESDNVLLKRIGIENMDQISLDHLYSIIAGPTPAIIDLEDSKPIMILQDFSYSATQIFRSFSGMYCEYTPIPKFKVFDFLEFAINHEIAHKMTKELFKPNNQILPGVDLGIDQNSISNRNFVEGIADAFGVLKHLQITGSDQFPKLISALRVLSSFSPMYQEFETAFSMQLSSASRKRVASEYCTTPIINAVINHALRLHQSGKLKSQSDNDLIKLAVNVAREFKLSESCLGAISVFATTINFNNYPYHASINRQFPRHKNSMSPYIVELCFDAVQKTGTFRPRGGDALEAILYADQPKSLFHSQSVKITDEMVSVFDSYREALKYFENNGVRPRTQEYFKQIFNELNQTLCLPINQTPNATILRELQDTLAGYDKFEAPFSGSWDCPIIREILEAADLHSLSFDRSVEYRRWQNQTLDSFEVLIRTFKS